MNTQTLSMPLRTQDMLAARHSNIGQLLLQQGKLTAGQAENVLLAQQELGLRFGEAAVRLGFLSERDIQEVLSHQFDYPCLALGDPALDPRLIAAYHNESAQVEALRSLRSQLILRWVSGGNKIIAVAGYDNDAAVGWLAANLAIVFSQLGLRTLLVDAALHAPVQHGLFRQPNRLGLSDILAGRTDDGCMLAIPPLPNLFLIPGGTDVPNKQELLSGAALGELLQQAEADFDIVIVSAPALKGKADGQLVAARAKGVVLLAEPGRSKVNDLEAARDDLRMAGATVLGCVLNSFVSSS
jgi:chain length determinant protein tyrosine kinase EpsG